ncbi:MAG: polysaccharide deacetylase family protein [Clostridia bacterium]|nr:polysaccharide deacetylase family protein [Clostridia bacterium]
MRKRSAALPALLILLLFVSRAFCAAGEELPAYKNDEEKRIYACGSGGKYLALTFDDGPHPVYTDRILKTLKKYGVRATFFVIGENVGYYPGVLERVLADGHAIGSHTFSHRHVSSVSRAQFFEEYRKNDRLLRSFGVETKLFRPPEGVCDAKVQALSARFDCDIILWSVDTEDWRSPPVYKIVRAVLDRVQGGEIILMHDYVSGESHTAAALEIILPELLSRGFEFVTVGELIGRTASERQ